MRCSRCQAENPAGMRFCGQCAAPLPAACPSCGAVNPAEHRFCSSCAAPLDRTRFPGFAEPPAGPPPFPGATDARTFAGEMKQVSVLFCDIVGSTALTERLGAEAMRDLVSRFLEISIAEVQRYDGTVPQFAGDGFMAIFGAPRTQEDHVRRALLAALGIRRALGGNGKSAGGGELDLPVRIGIHSGPVVFGRISGNFAMETAIGDTANLAARLQQAADPGAILISETTRRAARSYAKVDPIGPLVVKGKAEPIPAYRLLGVSLWRAARDGVMPERATGFVDRVDEVAVLQDFLDEAENGHGRVVGIVGEPGIGKSRIIGEIRRRLDPGQVTWVEGRCLSYGTAIPYLLFLDLLRNNCGIVETDTPEDIAEKVRAGLLEVGMDPDQDGPLLFNVLGIKGDEAPSAVARPEAVKEKTFEVFRRLAVAGSRRRPLVLALEDLHWVDALSGELVGSLAEDVADAGILILATYRPTFHPPWADKPYGAQIPLRPLSPGDSRDVLRSVLRDDPLADPVAEQIVVRADGNPLFLEQLALHAGEAKDRPSALMVPATIHDVVMARIDRLPDLTKRLLQTAAVIGREFSLRLLRAAWRHDGAIEPLLRELCRLDFLHERAEADGVTYLFRHVLTQEAAYGSLLERHRRAHHATIGRALETLYAGRTDEVAELLALHFGHSEEAEKAIDYLIAAAEKAQRRWANNEAQTYFDDARRRLDTLPDTTPNRLRHIDAVLKQAEVKYATGRHTEQIEALEGIRGMVEDTGDPPRRAAWHYWTGFLHSTLGSRPEVAIRHCREASKIASASGLDEIDAFADSCLAQVYIVAGRPRDAINAGERAVSSFEARGDLWWAGRTLWHLSSAANYLGQWEESRKYSRRALEHGTALDDLRLKAVSWWRMGVAHIQQGDLARGQQCCNEALALAPGPRDAAMAKAAHGYAEIKAGRVDNGIAEISEAVTWFDSSQLRFTHLHYSLWLAEGHLQRRDPANARPLIEEVLHWSRATGYLHFEGRACWLMSDCLAETPAAEDYAETAIRIFERVGAQNDLAKAMATRAALRRAAGDIDTARQLLDGAHAIFQALGTHGELVRVNAALAELGRSSQDYSPPEVVRPPTV